MLSTPKKYDINEPGTYDISKLLRICGYKCNVIYGDSVSTATLGSALNCLKQIGYSNANIVAHAVSTCKVQLNTNGPLFMCGMPNKVTDSDLLLSTTGHAWVVDGYDSCSYYIDYFREDNGEFFRRDDGGGYTYLHFNLGWDGDGDAFYLMSGAGTSANQNKFSDFQYNKYNYLITDITR